MERSISCQTAPNRCTFLRVSSTLAKIKMFSKRFFEILWVSFSISCYTGGTPYTFDIKTHLFIPFSLGLKLNLYFQTALIFGAAYLFGQTLRFYLEKNIEDFNICYALFLSWCFVFNAAYMTSIRSKDLMLSMNAFLTFLTRISSKF